MLAAFLHHPFQLNSIGRFFLYNIDLPGLVLFSISKGLENFPESKYRIEYLGVQKERVVSYELVNRSN